MLELDGGEGRRYNESFSFDGHQWIIVDKQEGVYAGGKAEYTGVRTFEVYADYQKGNRSLSFVENRTKYSLECNVFMDFNDLPALTK